VFCWQLKLISLTTFTQLHDISRLDNQQVTEEWPGIFMSQLAKGLGAPEALSFHSMHCSLHKFTAAVITALANHITQRQHFFLW
jgi:hypothetical protein